MNEQQFLDWCKEEVVKYTNSHLDKSDKKEITKDDVFMVWCCKILQNNKALLSTTLFDGMYYECTYNRDKEEMYFDAYKKWENKKIVERNRNMSEKSNILTINVKATEIDEVEDIISQFIFMLEDARIDRDIREQYLETCKPLKERFFVRIDKQGRSHSRS